MSNLSQSIARPGVAGIPVMIASQLKEAWSTFSPIVLKPQVLALCGLSYLLLVRLLRYRRLAQLQALFPPSKHLSSMTIQQAQSIWQGLAELEFPFFIEKGIQFALFRTYGIPTISSLLVNTSLFSEPASASKRYADTGAIVIEFSVRDFGSEESIQALARLNCIHGKYIKSGRILNDDMVYTLALFVREPVKWVNVHEWRTVDRVEKCAIGVFWKAIGDSMQISWAGLPGHDSGEGWQDGLHWFDEISAWADAYETEKMVPADSNAKTAEQTTAILLWNFPPQFQGVGRQAVGVLMDERLRRAMKYENPPETLTRTIEGVLSFRKWLIRHVFLPRPWIFRYHNVTDERTKQDTIYMKYYQSLPYYVKPTLLNRWGPETWLNRLRGLPVPGDEGDKYFPGGYRTVDVGPNHGKKDQLAMEAKVREVATSITPYVFK